MHERCSQQPLQPSVTGQGQITPHAKNRHAASNPALPRSISTRPLSAPSSAPSLLFLAPTPPPPEGPPLRAPLMIPLSAARAAPPDDAGRPASSEKPRPGKGQACGYLGLTGKPWPSCWWAGRRPAPAAGPAAATPCRCAGTPRSAPQQAQRAQRAQQVGEGGIGRCYAAEGMLEEV